MIQQDEMKGGIRISELVEHLGLAVVNKGDDFETALVGIKDVNRPGLQLVGFFDYFDNQRIQLIGKSEMGYLSQLTPEQEEPVMEKFMAAMPPLLIRSTMSFIS